MNLLVPLKLIFKTKKKHFETKYLLVKVIIEFVVAGKSQQNTEARSQRKKDLTSSIHPHLRTLQNCQVGRQVVIHAFD